ncbi:MAG: orotate phosphoribosyltransferase [Bacteroidetes bacterium GWE2_29_8]|nr:MAG: orotate phosphoribosyltransferase [Bacteroidetes bacterium GWE2_29_8]OFY17160.1 MAG: orotate phosphoribosyltransferase [Bacteroidetes bacterium GWF2_29_10]
MKNFNETSAKIAEYLLQIKAIKINTKDPFVWASGIQSPIYTDNRKTLSYPQIRTFIRQEFVKLINEGFTAPDMIAGVATGGIPFGVIIAQELGLPFIYVRSTEKKHGLSKNIEGDFESGKKVIVVEDLISTGSSSLKVVNLLQEHGCIINGLVSIFNYDLKISVSNFNKAKIKTASLTNFDALIEKAIETNSILPSDKKQLLDWHKNPEKWQPQTN